MFICFIYFYLAPCNRIKNELESELHLESNRLRLQL